MLASLVRAFRDVPGDLHGGARAIARGTASHSYCSGSMCIETPTYYKQAVSFSSTAARQLAQTSTSAYISQSAAVPGCRKRLLSMSVCGTRYARQMPVFHSVIPPARHVRFDLRDGRTLWARHLSKSVCAALGRDPGGAPGSPAAAGVVLLGALRRAALSAPNRAVLLSLDLLPTLAAALSAVVSSLNALTASLGTVSISRCV